MKSKPVVSQIVATVIGLIMIYVPRTVLGQDYTVNTFDSTNEASLWGYWSGWTTVDEDFEFDPNMDASGDTNTSGALRITTHFDWDILSTNEYWFNQMLVLRNFDEVIDGTAFGSMEMDLCMDTNSARRIGPGDFGDIFIDYVAQYVCYDFNWTNSHIAIPADYQGGWIHLSIPIDPAAANVDQITGLVLKEWAGDSWNGISGDVTFWVDNVKFVTQTTTNPPPVLSLEKTRLTGLQIFASQPTDRWQRQGIRTTGTNYSWVEATNLVTYSLTIADFPAPDPTSDPTDVHNAHVYIFFVPDGDGANLPHGPDDSPVDWNAGDVAFFRLQYETLTNQYEKLGVGYVGRFAFKTNQPGSQAMMFPDPTNPPPAGMLAAVASSTPLGTWNITFSNSTNVSLSGPGGVHANGIMPPEAADKFAGPLYCYFGFQPDNPTNIGSSVTFSRIEITGVEPPELETFPDQTLDADWQVVAEDPDGVVPVPPDTACWLTWTLPDAGFGLQTSADLEDLNGWLDLPLPTRQLLGKRMVLLPVGLLGTNEFFRLQKP